MENSAKKQLRQKELRRKILVIGICAAMVIVMILPYLAVFFKGL